MATMHGVPTPRLHRSTYVSSRRDARRDRRYRSRLRRLVVVVAGGGSTVAALGVWVVLLQR